MHRSSLKSLLQVCLFGPPKLELRTLLRAGMKDEEILSAIGVAVKGKKFAHDGNRSPAEIASKRNQPMVRIGG